MPTYLAEAYLPQSEASGLTGLAERLAAACAAVSRPGQPVRCLRAMRLPSDELCLCLLTAPCPEAVHEAAALAGLRHAHVSEAEVS